MILGVITSHQPSDTMDYNIDYADFFADTNDVIDTADVKITPDDSTLVVQEVVVGDNMIKIWVLGGTAGIRYKVEVTVTTVAGRIKQDELFFDIQEY